MSGAFDWSQFPKVERSPENAQIEQPSFDWNQFPVYEASEAPSLSKDVVRHTARSGARIAETVGAAAGNLLNLPETVTKYLAEKISGKPQPPQVDQANRIIRKILPGANLPTSERLRNETKKFTGEFLEPKGQAEAFSDELISDFASLALPVKGRIPFLRSIALSLGSNLAEKGSELFGAKEGAQSATKMGALFLLSSFKPDGAKKYAEHLFSEAKKAVPKGATIPAQNISKAAKALEAELKKGGTASFKTPALTKAKEIQSKIKKGRIAVDELTQFKIDINQARSGLYGDASLDKAGRKMAKRYLDSTARVVDDALTEYGHVNPQWEKFYRPANEAFGAIAQSKRVGNAIKRFVKQNPHTAGAAVAAELFLAPKTLPAAVAAYGVFKTGELIARIAKSKTLQGYYSDVVKAALNEDAATMSKYLNKLDAGLKKEENKR